MKAVKILLLHYTIWVSYCGWNQGIRNQCGLVNPYPHSLINLHQSHPVIDLEIGKKKNPIKKQKLSPTLRRRRHPTFQTVSPLLLPACQMFHPRRSDAQIQISDTRLPLSLLPIQPRCECHSGDDVVRVRPGTSKVSLTVLQGTMYI